jgi:hypothetical protein
VASWTMQFVAILSREKLARQKTRKPNQNFAGSKNSRRRGEIKSVIHASACGINRQVAEFDLDTNLDRP